MESPESPFDSRLFMKLLGAGYLLLVLVALIWDPYMGPYRLAEPPWDALVTVAYIGTAFLLASIWDLFRGSLEFWRIGLLGILIMAGSIFIIRLGKAENNVGVLALLAAFLVSFTMGGLQKGWGFQASLVFSAFILALLLAVKFLAPPLEQEPSPEAWAEFEKKFYWADRSDSTAANGQDKTSKLASSPLADPNVFERPESEILGSPSGLPSTPALTFDRKRGARPADEA